MPTRPIPRLILLICGLSVLAFGVALSIRSGLGTSPISSVPYAFSYILPLSVGILTVILHILMIVLQMFILGKNFKWLQWLQLPVGMIFGFFIDSMMWLTQTWSADHYFFQLLFCIASCIITAVGVCMIIRAGLVTLAAEGLFLAISTRFQLEFGTCKTTGDIMLVLIAVISSYLCLHEIIGVREGTIITALLVGTLVRKFMPYLNRIEFTQPKVPS